MTKIVIFDGPRGVGKTTVISALVAELERLNSQSNLLLGNPKLNFEVFKSERPDDPFQQMHLVISEFLRQPNKIWICDRFSCTEYVMSLVHGRVDPHYLTEQIRSINLRLQNLRAWHCILQVDEYNLDYRLEHREPPKPWDMPPEQVEIAWRAAIGLTPDARVYENRTKEQFAQILNDTLSYCLEGVSL